jgi:hypothetical protein
LCESLDLKHVAILFGTDDLLLDSWLARSPLRRFDLHRFAQRVLAETHDMVIGVFGYCLARRDLESLSGEGECRYAASMFEPIASLLRLVPVLARGQLAKSEVRRARPNPIEHGLPRCMRNAYRLFSPSVCSDSKLRCVRV